MDHINDILEPAETVGLLSEARARADALMEDRDGDLNEADLLVRLINVVKDLQETNRRWSYWNTKFDLEGRAIRDSLEVTPELVDLFKVTWGAADAEGKAGSRVATALQEVFSAVHAEADRHIQAEMALIPRPITKEE